MTNHEMTREQAILTIYRTAKKYGLEISEPAKGYDIPGIKRKDNAYIDIAIQEEDVLDSYNPDDKTIQKRLAVRGSVCQMNPNADAQELFRASTEMLVGAQFVLEMQRLNVTWMETI